MTQWKVTKSLDKIITNSTKNEFFKSLKPQLETTLNHEEKISSKGSETQFRRNNNMSEEIGRKYRIMRVLQAEETKVLGGKNASLLSRNYQTRELCQNLTAEISKPDCLPSNCKSSDPYRSIDGCCNNLEFPTQGIVIQVNQSKC